MSGPMWEMAPRLAAGTSDGNAGGALAVGLVCPRSPMGIDGSCLMLLQMGRQMFFVCSWRNLGLRAELHL